jgi:hypothetical protein
MLEKSMSGQTSSVRSFAFNHSSVRLNNSLSKEVSLTKSMLVGIQDEQVLEIVTPEKFDELQEFVDQENTMKEAIKI